MKAFLSFALIVSAAWSIGGCMKKIDDGKIPITTSSEDARKEFLQGREHTEKLELTNSSQQFDKAIALDSTFATAYLSRANVSFTAKEFFDNLNQAVAHAGSASEGERLIILAAEAGANGNVNKQKEDLAKVVELFPNDERAHFNYGTYFFGQQEYAQAIEEYKKAVTIAPNFSPVYNILGYAYRQVDNYSEAERMFKKYVELIPADPNPYDSYAELLLKMGRFDESIINYQKALAIDSNFSSSRIGIATNLMYKGKYDDALAALKKLYELARNDGERRQSVFTQAVVYVDCGKMELALGEADKEYAIAEKTNDVASMSGDIAMKANILLDMGKHHEALAAFERSAQLITTSSFSQEIKDNTKLIQHYNNAKVALDKKDLNTAKTEAEEFRKGTEANGNSNQIRLAHELAGRIALAEKKSDAAIGELLQSNQQDPYDLYRTALAYQMKGDKAQAKEFYKKAAHFNGLPQMNYAFVRSKAEKMLATM